MGALRHLTQRCVQASRGPLEILAFLYPSLPLLALLAAYAGEA